MAKVGVLVDWFRVTLPAGLQEQAIERLGGAVGRRGGWRGWYDRGAEVAGGGVVAWCDGEAQAARQGVLVELPGEACAALGDRLEAFMRWTLAVGGRVARVDYAIDDRRGRLTFERLRGCTETGRVVSSARRCNWWLGGDVGGPRDGWTLYVGRPGSQCMVRIYDKAAQMGDVGQAPVVTGEASGWERGRGWVGPRPAPPAPWVRVEMVCREAFAHAMTVEALRRGPRAVVEQVGRRVRFVEEPDGADSNVYRWPVCGWWRSVLSFVAVGKCLLPGESARGTVDKWRGWVERAVAPVLAAICAADGMEALAEIVRMGEERQGARHRGAVASARASARALATACGGG